jgi:hypothetical protein
MMNEDFLNAHERHWDDAEFLFAKQRWANADHLYGISAECGLKGIIEKFKGGPLDQGEKRHIMESKKPPSAWDTFEMYRSGHQLGSKFAMPANNPFINWETSQRYANQSNFDKSRVELHRKGAELIMEFVITANLEGLL